MTEKEEKLLGYVKRQIVINGIYCETSTHRCAFCHVTFGNYVSANCTLYGMTIENNGHLKGLPSYERCKPCINMLGDCLI